MAFVKGKADEIEKT